MGMITVKRYDEDDKIKWNDFLVNSREPMFMFDRNYMDYHSCRFQDHSLLFYAGENMIAEMPASEDGDMLVSHGGLTYGGMISGMDMHQTKMLECFDALGEYCVKMGISCVLYKKIPHIFHSQPSEDDIYALYRENAEIFKIEASTVVNIKNPIEKSKLRKRQIRKAIRNGVTVEQDNTRNGYIGFMKLQEEILKKRHNSHAVHSGDEMFLLYSRFPNNIKLYVAKMDGELIGGTIIFIYDDAIHTQYLCANDKARENGGLDLTIVKVLEDYRETKTWLDFGISTEDNGKILNEGLILQKEGFGGRTNVYSTWKLF